MQKSKTAKVVDAIFLVVVAICLAIVFIFYIPTTTRDKAEATSKPTTLATTAETTNPIPEPTEAETIATEATEPLEPAIPLYDIPLDADLQLHIIHTCEEKHIDPAIVMAMAFRESSYRTDAIGDGGNSYGLLQVQPRWHYGRMQRLGCADLLDPYQNVTVAVDYLCELLNRYGSIDKALTAYNRGSYSGTVTEYAKSVIATAKEMAVA